MPAYPPAAAYSGGITRHREAVQSMGEGLRSGSIIHGSGAEAQTYTAAIWRHDGSKPALMEGGIELAERIVFSIRKTDLAAPFAWGTIVVYDEMGRAYRVDVTDQETADHIAWRFEASRVPGSDPS